MRVRNFTSAVAAVAIGTFALASYAGNNDAGHNWVPKQPENRYWQAPDWSNFDPSSSEKPPRQAHTPPPQSTYARPDNRRQRPAASPQARRSPAYRPYPGNNPASNQLDTRRPPTNKQPGNEAATSQNTKRGYPPPPVGPYSGTARSVPDNGASAFNMPGYNRYRDNRRKSNKFWGRSGPGRWMNPSKNNLERGWDDMMNAPSRMGEMPGGWTAPEVSVPNPIDVGDQMQDNVKDLPDQASDMDIGK